MPLFTKLAILAALFFGFGAAAIHSTHNTPRPADVGGPTPLCPPPATSCTLGGGGQ